MKKHILPALLLVAVLTACSEAAIPPATTFSPGDAETAAPVTPVTTTTTPAETTSVPETPEPTNAAPIIDVYYYIYNGYPLVLGERADEFIAAAGEPDDIFESASCAFEGIDKILYYPGFIIYTFPVDGVDFILAITLETAETPEGVGLGAPEQTVIDIYGTPDEQNEVQIKYTKHETDLIFLLDDGAVFDITYYYTGAGI